MKEIKEKRKQIEGIEKRGLIINSEEKRIKDKLARKFYEKVEKSGWSEKFDKRTSFPEEQKKWEEFEETYFEGSEIGDREKQYNKQNRDLEKKEVGI